MRDPWDVDLDGRDVRGGQPGTLPDNGQHHAVTGEGRKTEIGQEEGLARHATARVIGYNQRPPDHPTTTALGTGVGVHGYDPGYMGSVHGSPASRGGTHG